MINENIHLTADEIYGKEFKIDAKGYRAQEVDDFLNLILDDYEEFQSLFKKLHNANRTLTEENEKLKMELRKLQGIMDSAKENVSNSKPSFSNIDLLKRISNLEKIVYGKDE